MKNRLEYYRLSVGYSQEKFGLEAGLTQRTIVRIENGEVRPRPYTMKKIVETLNKLGARRDYRELTIPDVFKI